MNRIDRLQAILIQLQSRSRVKAQQLADKFSISLRTVYRDIHALQEAGVPVIGEAGSGYSLMEGYKLPPVMFNQDEATALLTAAKLMESKADARLLQHYTNALDKIKAVLRGAEKNHIEEIDERVAVLQHPSFRFAAPAEMHLQPILRALAGGCVLQMSYAGIDSSTETTRAVEPIGIYNLGSYWHLAAFCRLRNDYRNFRTDRIVKLAVLQEKIQKTHPPLQAFLNRISSECEVTKVVIEVERDVLKYLGEQKYYHGFIKEEDAGPVVRLTFLTGSLQGFARWLMMFGECVTVLEPLQLTERVVALAEAVLKKAEQSQLLLT